MHFLGKDPDLDHTGYMVLSDRGKDENYAFFDKQMIYKRFYALLMSG
jgi:hypothetical protein